jgi:hypothetical protein
MSASGTQRYLAAILAVDVVGYGRLMGQDEGQISGGLHHYQHSHEFLNCDNTNARQIVLVYLRQFEFPKALFNAILG